MSDIPAGRAVGAALYVVATPIGNLADLTLRALDVLRAADLIACEDTRHSMRLLQHYGVRAELIAVHEHNERAAAARLVQAVGEGKVVALLSDAGTPGWSDPGARVVRSLQEAGLPVVPLPGPCAAVAALSAGGLLDEQFVFAGFLPPKRAARRAQIESLRDIPAALVFYEAPHRIAECVDDLAAVLQPEREILIARELSKTFEQIVRLPLPQAPHWLAEQEQRRRGEFVLAVSAAPRRTGAPLDAAAARTLAVLLAELPLKQAVKLAAELTGAARNALYEHALALSAQTSED
ncbi:MAG: 16S rRNA (cytidine(1402)-2'-O)-methyltransferase [Rhodocyclaceae bacterium]|nr:16S rRNA (cytidine(1402)-2'-O)-methyltransferase [Rhodocyclaceae bacterium]